MNPLCSSRFQRMPSSLRWRLVVISSCSMFLRRLPGLYCLRSGQSHRAYLCLHLGVDFVSGTLIGAAAVGFLAQWFARYFPRARGGLLLPWCGGNGTGRLRPSGPSLAGFRSWPLDQALPSALVQTLSLRASPACWGSQRLPSVSPLH